MNHIIECLMHSVKNLKQLNKRRHCVVVFGVNHILSGFRHEEADDDCLHAFGAFVVGAASSGAPPSDEFSDPELVEDLVRRRVELQSGGRS